MASPDSRPNVAYEQLLLLKIEELSNLVHGLSIEDVTVWELAKSRIQEIHSALRGRISALYLLQQKQLEAVAAAEAAPTTMTPFAQQPLSTNGNGKLSPTMGFMTDFDENLLTAELVNQLKLAASPLSGILANGGPSVGSAGPPFGGPTLGNGTAQTPFFNRRPSSTLGSRDDFGGPIPDVVLRKDSQTLGANPGLAPVSSLLQSNNRLRPGASLSNLPSIVVSEGTNALSESLSLMLDSRRPSYDQLCSNYTLPPFLRSVNSLSDSTEISTLPISHAGNNAAGTPLVPTNGASTATTTTPPSIVLGYADINGVPAPIVARSTNSVNSTRPTSQRSPDSHIQSPVTEASPNHNPVVATLLVPTAFSTSSSSSSLHHYISSARSQTTSASLTNCNRALSGCSSMVSSVANGGFPGSASGMDLVGSLPDSVAKNQLLANALQALNGKTGIAPTMPVAPTVTQAVPEPQTSPMRLQLENSPAQMSYSAILAALMKNAESGAILPDIFADEISPETASTSLCSPPALVASTEQFSTASSESEQLQLPSLPPPSTQHPHPKTLIENMFKVIRFYANKPEGESYQLGWMVLRLIWNVTPKDFDKFILDVIQNQKSHRESEEILLTIAAVDLRNVRNLSAFAGSILKEYETMSHVCVRFLAGVCPLEGVEQAQRNGHPPSCPFVHPELTPGWDLLRDRWNITFQSFDYGVINYLCKQRWEHREAILISFSEMNLGNVKNLSAYLSATIHARNHHKA